MTIRTVFFGTPEWAVPSLRALVGAGFDVACVVTNPDRPAGRGMAVTSGPVKAAAMELGIRVEQPRSAKTEDFAAMLAELRPDVASVVAYGKILPGSVLAIPEHGFVNLHFSLLPEYRGAAPVQRALMEGKKKTGASTMLLTEGMDEGPVLGAVEVDIAPDESAAELGARLATVGAPLLVDSVTGYVAGSIEPQPQDDARATYAPKITEEDARIDWDRPLSELADHVRGLDPAPGAWTMLAGRRLRVFKLRASDALRLQPGEIAVRKDLLIGCGDATAVVGEAQLEGKRRMSGRELANGLRLPDGARVE